MGQPCGEKIFFTPADRDEHPIKARRDPIPRGPDTWSMNCPSNFDQWSLDKELIPQLFKHVSNDPATQWHVLCKLREEIEKTQSRFWATSRQEVEDPFPHSPKSPTHVWNYREGMPSFYHGELHHGMQQPVASILPLPRPCHRQTPFPYAMDGSPHHTHSSSSSRSHSEDNRYSGLSFQKIGINEWRGRASDEDAR
jgi:hypothetical protein